MKTPMPLFLIVSSLLIPSARAGQLSDDFLSSQIDSNLWVPKAPFSDSSLNLTGGTIIFLNHGELVTKSDFAHFLEVTGRFRFTGNIHDVFTVAIRTTGAAPDPRFLNDGFHFEFAKQSDDGTRINVVQVAEYVSGVGTVVAATTYSFELGQYYDFKISDDGTNMNFYFDNLQTPILSVSDETTAGHKVGFYNREGTGGGSSISAGTQVEIDFISIEGPVDKSPPMILCPSDITVPCNSSLFVPVGFSVTATDDIDPNPTVVCSPAAGSRFPGGSTLVTCTATDAAGHQSHCSFYVNRAALEFTGFFPPIAGADLTGGTFANPVRTFKLNSTIPVTFAASCGGTPVLVGVHTLEATKFSSATTGDAPIDATPQDAATAGNQFRLTDGAWHYNLDPKKTGMSTGIWLLTASLSDGSEHSVWIQLK